MKKRSFWTIAFLGVWFSAIILGMASLMVNHIFAMPPPSDNEKLRKAAHALRRHTELPLAVHIIYQDCSCTNLLVDDLFRHGSTPGWEEAILFVGAPAERLRQAVRHGFVAHELSAIQLHIQWGVQAAPVLILLKGNGDLAYAGGYFETPATVNPKHELMRRQLLGGIPPAALPVYGCAVSSSLQSQTDPLGLKY